MRRSAGNHPTEKLKQRRWHPSQKNKKLKDGSLKLAFEVESLNVLERLEPVEP